MPVFPFSAYYSYLIGAKGATRKRLEHESGCRIDIPPRGVTGDVGELSLWPQQPLQDEASAHRSAADPPGPTRAEQSFMLSVILSEQPGSLGLCLCMVEGELVPVNNGSL